ncbi:uncharacterized protein LOC119267123 [Triticum dicoccoides]|uniref:uncharacterized protein LOC119267123 n=1 Tax=Triticum dicoccoides TaxID=85692 RepID=UPI00188DE008|nr:uncharacterized protein LOC119267123 [Triticum dicoccoides]
MPITPPFGLLEPLKLVIDDGRSPSIPESTPVHIMVPVDARMAVLVSIDGSGNVTVSAPSWRIPIIRAGKFEATTSSGAGPLSFVDLHTDGRYSGIDFPVPAGAYRSIGEIIKATCSCLSRPCPSHYRHEDGPSALQQPSDSSPTTTFEDLEEAMFEAAPTFEATSSTCPQAQAVTPGSPMSPILSHIRHDWGLEYYIRVDHQGSFHTYPDIGGPFQSLQQAKNAIDQHLHGRRHTSMCMEQAGVSQNEMGIRQCLFWPDGTRKKRTKSYIFKKGHEHISRLVCAIVDQYNEDHNLLGDLAYKLKDMVRHKSFREKDEWYRHLNFTAKIKGADGLDWFEKLFFVELRNTKQEESYGEWVVSCFCMVDPTDNGHCGGCKSGVRHPNKADAYTCGHVGADELCGCPAEWSDSDEDDRSKERRIRRMYKGRKPFVLPASAVPKETA